METKTLTINGVDYAKYQSGGDILYLKVLQPIGKLDERESEDVYANVISVLESKRFKMLSFLNI